MSFFDSAYWAAHAGSPPGGGGAPDDANYLVGTADAGLSAEIVVGTSPSGELGGTWASPTVDATHSGSSHAGVQSAAEATAAGALSAHVAAGDPHPVYALESGLGTAALVDTGTGAGNAILGNDARLSDARSNPGNQRTSTVAIANTETVITSYTCAANELAAGTTFLIRAFCSQAGTNAATPTVRIRVGTTTLTGNIAATLTGPAGSSAVPSIIEGLVTVRTNGAGGTIIGGLQMGKSGVHDTVNAQTGTVAVDTTAANMLIELTFISGNAANTYTFQEAVILKVRA